MLINFISNSNFLKKCADETIAFRSDLKGRKFAQERALTVTWSGWSIVRGRAFECTSPVLGARFFFGVSRSFSLDYRSSIVLSVKRGRAGRRVFFCVWRTHANGTTHTKKNEQKSPHQQHSESPPPHPTNKNQSIDDQIVFIRLVSVACSCCSSTNWKYWKNLFLEFFWGVSKQPTEL